VAESYRLGTNYDCSNPGCSFSAYVSDHTCSSTNYCFQ
jgi:hypothetical protein